MQRLSLQSSNMRSVFFFFILLFLCFFWFVPDTQMTIIPEKWPGHCSKECSSKLIETSHSLTLGFDHFREILDETLQKDRGTLFQMAQHLN